jgi:hypothetical protein
MATIDSVIAAGHLSPFELPEWESRLAIRSLFVTPDFLDWADDTDALHDETNAIGGRTLFEHLLLMFCEFRCAPRVRYGDIKRMMPTSKGVWKMHPPGLRIYGWCPDLQQFASVDGALESETKTTKNLNDVKRNIVLAFIKQHGLGNSVKYGDFTAVFPN